MKLTGPLSVQALFHVDGGIIFLEEGLAYYQGWKDSARSLDVPDHLIPDIVYGMGFHQAPPVAEAIEKPEDLTLWLEEEQAP